MKARKRIPDPERSRKMKEAWMRRRANGAAHHNGHAERATLTTEIDTIERIEELLQALPVASQTAVFTAVASRRGLGR